MAHHALKQPVLAPLKFAQIPLVAGVGIVCAYYRSTTLLPTGLADYLAAYVTTIHSHAHVREPFGRSALMA
eukprot:1191919-Prorocentrum_minimum.AAC.1